MATRERTAPHSSDVAEMLRLWFWYQAVKNVEGATDEKLDGYLREDVDRRHKRMNRVRRLGYKPRPELPDGDPDEFVWKIGSKNNYKETIDVWYGMLWKIISVNGCSHAEIQAFIEAYATQCGLYRFSDRETIAAIVLPPQTVWRQLHVSGVTRAYKKAIEYFVRHPTIDDLGFVLALFLEAAHYELFSHAIYLRHATARALFNYMYENKFGAPLARLTVDTIGLRGICRALIPQQRIVLPRRWSPYLASGHRDPQIRAQFSRIDMGARARRPWVRVTEELTIYRNKLKDLTEKQKLKAEAIALTRHVFRFEYSDLVRHASRFEDGTSLADLFDTELWPL